MGDLPKAAPIPGTVCEDCGFRLNPSAIGDLFCHVCSGVDQQPVSDCILYPVFERCGMYRDLHAAGHAAEHQKELATQAESVHSSATSNNPQAPSPMLERPAAQALAAKE